MHFALSMIIKSLSLENFRSYQKYQLNFDKTTIIVGPNGVGKTNIIEAIWFLSNGRSWRSRDEGELIFWDQDFARISAKLSDNHQAIEIFLSNGQLQNKQLKVDGVKRRFLELLGVMPAVLFTPESIQLIDGAPSLRRKFLDIVLSQINRQYALALLEYSKVLQERNKLLFHIKMGKSKPDELEFWDEKLVATGSAIMLKREELVKFFNQHISANYHHISGEDEELRIRYHPSVEREKFGEILIALQEREIEQTASTHGPHRDDFRLYLGDRDLATFGSRGEYRSAILALKMTELKFIESKIGEQPLLLLDDIFSELDSTRRHHLAKIVSGVQTIITTTDLDHIEESLRKKAKIIELS